MRIAATLSANTASDASPAGALPSDADGGFAALLAAALPGVGTEPGMPTPVADPLAADTSSLPLHATADTDDEPAQADAALQALLAGIDLLPRGAAAVVSTDAAADALPSVTAQSAALSASGLARPLPADASAPMQAGSDTAPALKSPHLSAAPDPDTPELAAAQLHAAPSSPARGEPSARDAQEAPAMLSLGSTAAAAPTTLHPSQAVLHVVEPLGTHRWEQAFSSQVVWAATEQLQSASLTLNPPELGPVRIELQLSDNQASASFSSPQPEVRKAIEDALPGLKTLFADAGLQLQHADVGSGDARQGQPRPAAFGAARARGQADDASLPTAETPHIISRRLLDTFA